MSGGIFLSRRPGDGEALARRLDLWMSLRFVERPIYRGDDPAPEDMNVPRALAARLANADALLLIIGPDWTSPENAARLSDPEDPVRAAVERAFLQDADIVPVLIDGAAMPAAESLPARLRPLTNLTPLRVGADAFEDDMNALATALIRGPLLSGWDVSVSIRGLAIYLLLPILLALFSLTVRVDEIELGLIPFFPLLAIWLGARFGQTGYLMLLIIGLPLLVGIRSDSVTFGGEPGVYFGSLLLARFAGQTRLRTLSYKANAYQRNDWLYLFILAPFFIEYQDTIGFDGPVLIITTDLYFYFCISAFMLGASSLGVWALARGVAIAFAIAFALGLLWSPFALGVAIYDVIEWSTPYASLGGALGVLVYILLGAAFRRAVADGEEQRQGLWGLTLLALAAALLSGLWIEFEPMTLGADPDLGLAPSLGRLMSPYAAPAAVFILALCGGGRGALLGVLVWGAVDVAPFIVDLNSPGALSFELGPLSAAPPRLAGDIAYYSAADGISLLFPLYALVGWRVGAVMTRKLTTADPSDERLLETAISTEATPEAAASIEQVAAASQAPHDPVRPPVFRYTPMRPERSGLGWLILGAGVTHAVVALTLISLDALGV